MPLVFGFDGSDLDWAVIVYFTEPGEERMQQFACEPVFIVRVKLHQAAERSTGNDAHIAGKCAFVFLIGDEGINFSGANERDVADLTATEVFLKENAFGIIDMLEPGLGVFEGFTKDGVNWTGGGAKGIFNNEGMRMPLKNVFGFEPIGGDV